METYFETQIDDLLAKGHAFFIRTKHLNGILVSSTQREKTEIGRAHV